MRISLIVLLSAGLAFSVTAFAGGSSNSGKKMYDASCALCHGANGKAAMAGAGDMTSPAGPLSKSNGVLVHNVLDGVGNMPGFKGQLTKDQVKAILAYMRQAFGVKGKN